MARVLITVRMDEEVRAVLSAFAREHGFEAIQLDELLPDARPAAWADADVVVCSGFPSEFPEDLASRAKRLRLVQTVVAGVDHLPFDRLPPQAIVCSNAGAYNTSVAEHAMSLLLASAKDVPRGTEEIRRGVFDQDTMNKVLRGSTLLIVGLGGIGREIAFLARAFGMRVLATRRSGRPDASADEIGTPADLKSFAARADFVVLTLPLTRETRGLIDADLLRTMKDDAVLVNVARGKLVVEDDLYEHLRAHPRFRAALDVWWTYPRGKEGRPFRRAFHELPNVVMTPHVAFAIPSQRRDAMEAALRNVLRFLRGDRLERAVDPKDYLEAAAGPAGPDSRRTVRT